METGYYRLFFFLIILSGCTSKTPEDRFLNLLEEKYANYYINKAHKKAVVSDLREYFKNHKLDDENLAEVKKKLSNLNDGHVLLADDRAEKSIYYVSGVKFYIGTELIESCEDCVPSIPKNKYKILEVNNTSYKNFQKNSKNNVSASTTWGRKYRISRLLQKNTDTQLSLLKLQSSSGKIVITALHWKKDNTPLRPCVTGERLGDDLFKVHVADLWCDGSGDGSWSRQQIIDNFEKQFDNVMSLAKVSDRIILELRENGGGGDEEVEYVLNAFLEKSVLLYHYQYLRLTHPGGLKWVNRFSPFKLGVWSDEEFQYTRIDRRPKNTFFKNKMVIITSAGCFSSCETIASVLKNEKRSIVIGTVTHGSSGDPFFFPIKGTHYSLNLPMCVNWQIPGVFYEGVGVSPDIEIYQNPDIEEDNILKAAIDLTQ